jgi:hypothetical protein
MKLTDSYNKDNREIIELAKRQFDTAQKSKLPTELIDLPSKGLVYPVTSPLRAGKVEMRYMTAYDEDILTNASYIQNGVVLDKLIDALLVTSVTADELISADKEALIIAARILSYGRDYDVIVTDPNTGKALNRVVDLTKLSSKEFNLIPDENGEFDYDVHGTRIKFTYVKSAELKQISDEQIVSNTLKFLIKQVGDSRSSADIDQFIQYKFLAADARKFRRYVAENAPGLEMQYEFEGEQGGTFKAVFQIGTDLFWI